jgi:hypothetical protein
MDYVVYEVTDYGLIYMFSIKLNHLIIYTLKSGSFTPIFSISR